MISHAPNPVAASDMPSVMLWSLTPIEGFGWTQMYPTHNVGALSKLAFLMLQYPLNLSSTMSFPSGQKIRY